MYEVFEKLCESRNVTPYKVSKETGDDKSDDTEKHGQEWRGALDRVSSGYR